MVDFPLANTDCHFFALNSTPNTELYCCPTRYMCDLVTVKLTIRKESL